MYVGTWLVLTTSDLTVEIFLYLNLYFLNDHYLSFINSLGKEFIAFLVYNGYDHVEHNIISIKTGKILVEVLSIKT